MILEPFKPDEKPLEYMQFPRFLNEIDGLSLNAKVAYMLIYDRIRQSAKNDLFTDESGSSFCFFSNEELAGLSGLSKPTITRTVSELKEKGLLKREKDRSNRTKNFIFSPVSESNFDDTKVKNRLDQNQILMTPKSNFDDTKVKNRLDQNQILISPFPYISKNNDKEQHKENTCVETNPEEPPKPKKKNKAEEATKAVIEHWNEKYQTKYSSESKGTIKLVDAILKSGYELDQILQVIDYRAKTRKTEADYKWFVPATVLALKNFERSYQFMINDQTKPQTKTVYGSQPSQGYRNRNNIPESVTLPSWYEVKPSEQASESDVKKILELQNSILKGA